MSSFQSLHVLLTALPSSATPRTFPTIKTQTPPSQGKVTYAPQTTPRVQPSPNKGITFKQQTGFINGPSGKLPDKRKGNLLFFFVILQIRNKNYFYLLKIAKI